MAETDWREILSFSQKELMQADKEKLCESLSWMEADDIELNFTDLKTLFRLAQDILKYKSEQVNNLLGQIETTQRKGSKSKSKGLNIESPTRGSDSPLETLAHQEEVIKANKEILEQLYADIAELEGLKNKLEDDKTDKDSESSRDPLSEMNAVVKLENDVTMKNRHIRKLLNDVKTLEEENTKLKEKITVLKDKLTEATQLIDNLTEQIVRINKERLQLREILGKSEQAKSQLTVEIEYLRKDMIEKESKRENIYEEFKSKVQHWKNIARSKKVEIKALTIENAALKEDLIEASRLTSSPKRTEQRVEEIKMKELQEKLSEASYEIKQSANLINLLRAENKQLKTIIDDTTDSIAVSKNQSDDGKERIMINKLKVKVNNLSIALQNAEEMVAKREKELTEITSQLQLLQTNDGINALFEGLKSKKRQIRVKDEGIKSLVQEVNNLSQVVNDLQLENEALRQEFNISAGEKIPTTGIMKKYYDMEHINKEITRELKDLENKLVIVELDNHKMKSKIAKMSVALEKSGYNDNIDDIQDGYNDAMPTDGGGESSTYIAKPAQKDDQNKTEVSNREKEINEIIEENEGLRKGLQEILIFLKDNSTTSSGILALQCPSLDTILQAMEARHSAGWFAPHMITVMQLREALGGKDALITALHDARKETFDVMTQLSKEAQKSSELEQRLNEIESKNKPKESEEIYLPTININICEFGSWISEKEQNNIDFYDKSEINNIITKENNLYEVQLKKGLEYFHNRFKALFNKMTDMVMQATDDRNKWDIQEEQYKAEIENLKGQLHQIEEEDISDCSPGLAFIPSVSSLQRKCSYLEESYKYIRTLNENMKNENLEGKKDAMIISADYEAQIQELILAVANLTDKLRSCISINLFWKQNVALNEYISKYRKLVHKGASNQSKSLDLLKLMEKDKIDIINYFEKHFEQDQSKSENCNTKKLLSKIEQSILQKQVEQVCSELEDKNKKIEHLEKRNMELQESQSKIIDQSLASITKEDVELMKDQLQKFADENKILKEQCQHVGSQLDIALLQLQDKQHRQMSNDLEINILRHQIIDLQSTDDSKAIVARLGGEVLVAHLQASESHKKIERLNSALYKEKELRAEAEEMLKARHKIFEVYSIRFESKFRYMYEIMQILRQQYQGSLPLASLENYLNKMEELNRNNQSVNDKLYEIEDLQSSLMIKHSVYDQILDLSKNKCLIEEDSCVHKLKYLTMQSIHSREIDHMNKKLTALEQFHEESIKNCNYLEKSLVLVNQGFEKSSLNGIKDQRNSDGEISVSNLELEDIQSDDESSSRKSQTITLPRPQVLKPQKTCLDTTNVRETTTKPKPPVPLIQKSPKSASVSIQTIINEISKKDRTIQTEDDKQLTELKLRINTQDNTIRNKNKELSEAIMLAQQCTKDFISSNTEKSKLEYTINHLKDSYEQKDALNKQLQISNEELRKQLDDFKEIQAKDKNNLKEIANGENTSLLLALKQLENDKNDIVEEYKNLLNNEREEYAKSMKEMHSKITALQTNLERRESDFNVTNQDSLKDIVNKYTMKTTELEDKCFKLQSELDECKSEVTTYQSESERWKSLASERLKKMEHLNSQLKERHCHEVDSYKAENQHWLSQLSDTQREHMELRSRLTEQKAFYVKQLADKDSQIEQLRSIVHNLKTQIMNMQTMISVNDPSFDLSAIVEVEEASDGLSQHGSDRLELKFDSTGDLLDMHDDTVRMPSTSSAIWQEPIIERLRREKQMASKQNNILRRQIKALAARERRSRLDAQNLKNQVFRINTSGTKVTTVESAALQHKIASLQAQLTNARRDTHSSIALWDKWKRAQQTSERWQARYSEKCQEVTKLESGLNLAKSALSRLEKEKKVLLSRLTEVKHESQLAIEKQDTESLEKSHQSSRECVCMKSPPAVSSRALLDRVQAQQRRIAALEFAEKGNEFLVSEYEKSLAEITSLKGQVLKLESTLLESQIRTPLKATNDTQPELEYWKSYCEMLKEENVQLTLKVNSLETTPSTTNHHRINDLEQTVLTLRGLVSKLQADQKTSGAYKKVDSRPSSGRSSSDKGRNQLESHRVEIVNLKHSIQEKDLLLERSKEMLKIAAEREDELLRENEFLRRRLDDMNKQHGGFLSA